MIGWCDTWNLELDMDIVDVWKKIVICHTRHELSVLVSQSLDKQDIKSHGAAICELHLSEVIHSIFLEQILRESK
jgi:hypothetical protein